MTNTQGMGPTHAMYCVVTKKYLFYLLITMQLQIILQLYTR